jgi:hypothetical protein
LSDPQPEKMHDAHRGKGMEVQSPLSPVHCLWNPVPNGD